MFKLLQKQTILTFPLSRFFSAASENNGMKKAKEEIETICIHVLK